MFSLNMTSFPVTESASVWSLRLGCIRVFATGRSGYALWSQATDNDLGEAMKYPDMHPIVNLEEATTASTTVFRSWNEAPEDGDWYLQDENYFEFIRGLASELPSLLTQDLSMASEPMGFLIVVEDMVVHAAIVECTDTRLTIFVPQWDRQLECTTIKKMFSPGPFRLEEVDGQRIVRYLPPHSQWVYIWTDVCQGVRRFVVWCVQCGRLAYKGLKTVSFGRKE